MIRQADFHTCTTDLSFCASLPPFFRRTLFFAGARLRFDAGEGTFCHSELPPACAPGHALEIGYGLN